MAGLGKQTSRWGSFLQQALDGVESRLDNILVGDGPLEHTVGTAPGASTTTLKPENGNCFLIHVYQRPLTFKWEGPTRGASATNSTNDRLQERLARAIAAKKYAAQKPESHTSSNIPSRVGSPVTTVETPRKSLDNLSVGSEDAGGDKKQNQSGDTTVVQRDESQGGGTSGGANNKDPAHGHLQKSSTESPRPSMESSSSNTGRPSVDLPNNPSEMIASTPEVERSLEGPSGGRIETTTENEATSKQQQSDLEISDLQRQEEIHSYIERIDALQAKLQYLSRESAEAARKAAAAASSGSAEKKLAEKDEQIALLMEEGQKLSKTELKHMTIIKKLRAKVAESEKEDVDSRKKLEKVEKEKALLSEQMKKVEAMERQSLERQKVLTQLQKDNEAIAAERDAKNQIIAELKAQLLESTSQAKASEVKAIEDQLALERRRVAELEDDISSLKVEKELAAGRAKAQLEELRAKSEREAERARVAEVEMRAEQQMLESRLELMRTRAEEVSSGVTGDAQAKLLRQIETLQTQYAVASENWQGIEASLNARVTSLEKERDEALKRESDIRRKAREAVSSNKIQRS
jgi:TATA element modulatory factor